ncbi:substrate-binding periplasmic protein [Silvanigrella sp.]|jgi:polar amino acid transport system substrate-binding protein|uniref:substrate-binding periplasmic protein n=1 Tax=Silvanigrella sp. TaxID=2024976 RepID=UPI0037CA5B7F
MNVNKVKFYALFFFSFFIFENLFAAEEEIKFETDIWCPYTCDEKLDGSKGFVIDAALKIFAEHHIKFSSSVAPWARVLIRTEKGEIDAMGAAYKEGREEKYLFPEEDFGKSTNSFFVLKGNKWKYKTPESLKDIILGITIGYVYGGAIDTLNKFAKKVSATGGDNGFERNLDKVNKKEIDAVIEESIVGEYTLKKSKLNDKISEAGTIGKKAGVYIAFTKAKPTSLRYAKILSDGLKKMKKNGEYQKILKKYGLNPAKFN